MAMVKAQIYYPYMHLYGRTKLVLQALIIVQTIIHHHSKVFTTGQARVNPETCVIKYVTGFEKTRLPRTITNI